MPGDDMIALDLLFYIHSKRIKIDPCRSFKSHGALVQLIDGADYLRSAICGGWIGIHAYVDEVASRNTNNKPHIVKDRPIYFSLAGGLPGDAFGSLVTLPDQNEMILRDQNEIIS